MAIDVSSEHLVIGDGIPSLGGTLKERLDAYTHYTNGRPIVPDAPVDLLTDHGMVLLEPIELAEPDILASEPDLATPEIVLETELVPEIIEPIRRLSLRHRIGSIAAAASLKLSLLEPGKKLNSVKDGISQAGYKANFAFGKGLDTVSKGLEKVSENRKPVALAIGAVALLGMTVAAYKTGINPFGSGSHAAEKADHFNDAAQLVVPPKAPSAEHTQPLQQLSAVAKPQHTEVLATTAPAVHHKPNTGVNIHELTWNVAHQKAPGHEMSVIQQALPKYSVVAGQPVELVNSNGHLLVKVGDHIINQREMTKLNEIIAA